MNEKELREKRDQIVEQMQAITDNATNVEKRTLTTEEQQKFAGLKKEVEDIDATLEAMEQSRTLLPPVKTPEKKEPVEDIEIRTFANIIRNRVDANITKTANGAVIPTTIAKKIIDVAKDRSPLFKDAEKYNIRGYKYDGYYARICGLKSYFDENMKLLDDENLDALFTGGQIYTKIRDDNPTRYINGCKTKNNLVADGCVIEGDVENCVLFRGVKIAKGAKIRNSVLMQDTVVKAGARLDYVVTDKNVTIEVGQELKGTDTQPFYVAKGHTV